MKKIFILSVLCALALAGCAEHDLSSSEVISETAPTTEEPTETERSEPYVHGDDGYFNLVEEGNQFNMRYQNEGTCWAFAGAAAIESAYYMRYKSAVEIDPLEIINAVYNNDKEEGYFLADGVRDKTAGGNMKIIGEALSKGFGGLTVDNMDDLYSIKPDDLKEYIKKNGAVAVSVYDSSGNRGWYHDYYIMRNSDNKDTNHAVVIVGWDDHFPKEYFIDPAQNDGAWICYNSNIGSQGYGYLSYETYFRDPVAFSVTDEYSDVLSYDCGTEIDSFLYYGEDDGVTLANVFDKPGTLSAVGVSSLLPEENITIEVYTDDFSKLLYSQDAFLEYSGYHTIKLDKPLEVDKYALAVRYTGPAPLESDSFGFKNTNDITFKSVIKKGQSYVLLGDKWKDLADKDAKELLQTDFTPKNACIKALYTN